MSKKANPSTTVQGRIEAFYRGNPDEWLSLADIMAKFGCTRSTAYSAITELRAELRDGGAGETIVCERVYRLGRPGAQS